MSEHSIVEPDRLDSADRGDHIGNDMGAQLGIDIGEVARRSGLATSTLRYYEQIGLISSIGRIGNRRRFDESIFDRLELIALGRVAGFALSEIDGIFGSDGSVDIDRGELQRRADELGETIERLTTLRTGLEHAARCPEPSHLECATFRRLMRLAGSGKIGPLNPAVSSSSR